MADESESAATERRIEGWIAGTGTAAVVGAGIGWGGRAAAGAAIGAGLCWLNFHWLRQGAAGVIRLGLAQAGAAHATVPRTTHAKFLGRFALLLLAVYAILVWLRLPAVAVLCGLAAVVPAIICELGYELMRGHHRWNAR